METLSIQKQVSPLDALLSHFYSSPKRVQRAFAKIIVENRAEEMAVARQKAMMRQSINQAFQELKAGKARPVEDLFAEL